MVATLPRITIITPCRNGARYIAEAVGSILSQRYPNLEHIVFDACSTDETLTVLRRFPEVTVISEPDNGSHDAMNRGLARASGEIIGFLNVDDIYPPELLDSVGRLFAADPTLDVVVGGALMFEDDGPGRRRVLLEWTHSRENGLWLPELAFGVPGINGWFFRRTVFDRIGEFDNSYSFSADRRSLILVALAGLKARLLGRPGIHYRRHADSRTINRQMANLRAITQEHIRMAMELAGRLDASPSQRRMFLAWHAFEGAKLSLREALSGRFRDALNLLLELFRRNPLWPVRLAHGVMLRLAVGWLNRHAGSPKEQSR